jgi:hypothetical protein
VTRNRLQGEEGSGDIDVKGSLVIRPVDLDDRGSGKDCCIVDKNINLTECGQGLRDRPSTLSCRVTSISTAMALSPIPAAAS